MNIKGKYKYKITDIAQLLGLNRSTVNKMLQNGTIKGVKVKMHVFASKANMWVISEEEYARLERLNEDLWKDRLEAAEDANGSKSPLKNEKNT